MEFSSRHSFAPIAMLVIAFLALAGCSSKKEEAPTARIPAQRDRPETGAEVREGSGPAREVEKHMVDRCRKHRYYVAPGETAIVKFETEVDAELAKLAAEEEPAVDAGELEAAGYSVFFMGRSIESFSADRPVWVVNEPRFAVKEGETLRFFGVGVGIRWNNDGEGTITSVSRHLGEFAVGKLSFHELVNALGGKDKIPVKGPDDLVYHLAPVQRQVSKEIHLLSVELRVKAPDSSGKREAIRHGSVLWRGKGVQFSRDLDSRTERYYIVGPASGRECFE